MPTKPKIITRSQPEPATPKPNKRRTPPKGARMDLWRRDIGEQYHGKCYVCSGPLSIENFEAGHVIAVAKGGSDCIDNLRVVCSPCNKGMGTQHMEDYKTTYYPNIPALEPPMSDMEYLNRSGLYNPSTIAYHKGDGYFAQLSLQEQRSKAALENFRQEHTRAEINAMKEILQREISAKQALRRSVLSIAPALFVKGWGTSRILLLKSL